MFYRVKIAIKQNKETKYTNSFYKIYYTAVCNQTLNDIYDNTLDDI